MQDGVRVFRGRDAKALGGDPAYLGHDLFFFNVDTAKEQRQRAVCGGPRGVEQEARRSKNFFFFGYSPLALSQ